MGKLTNYIKKNLTALVIIAVVFVVTVVSFFLTGALFKSTYNTLHVKFGALFFGNSFITQTETSGYAFTVPYTGGVSYYGIASLIFLVSGLVFLVLDTLFYAKKFDVLGYGFLVIAGLLTFIVLQAGSTLTAFPSPNYPVVQQFKDSFANYSLGVGAYVYGLVNIFCGILGLVLENPLRYSIRKTKKRRK